MEQRGIAESDVTLSVRRGSAAADAAPAGAYPRVRYTATQRGRIITVVVAHEPARLVVITVF